MDIWRRNEDSLCRSADSVSEWMGGQARSSGIDCFYSIVEVENENLDGKSRVG